MNKDFFILLFLRLGLAFTFLYAAIASFIDPNSWVGFLPSWIKNIIDGNILLTIFSVYEIILGLWLIYGKWLYYGSILAVLTLFGIVVTNIGAFDLVFRDVGLLLAAIALMLLSKK